MSGTCWNPVNWGDCIESGATDVGVSVVAQFVQWSIQMVGDVAGTVVSWWVKVPTAGFVGDGTIQWVWDHLSWLTMWVGVLSLLLAAGRIALQRRAEPAIDAVKGMVNLAVVTSAAYTGLVLLTSAGDSFSEWIINQALQGQDFGNSIVGWLVITNSSGGPLLALGLAQVATLACLFQVGLMLVRTAMLILLMGVLPLSAAASTTATGQNWFKKICAWMLAFILYKPVAAVVYAAAFKMISSLKTNQSSNGLIVSVAGIIMLILAVIALPAMMRLLVPMVDKAGGGSGGAGGALGAASSLASGAKAISGAKSGGGGASGRGGGGGNKGSAPQGSKTVPSQSAPAAQGAAQGAGAAAAKAGATAAKVNPVGAAATVATEAAKTVKKVADGAAGSGGTSGGPDGSQ
ncbi:hypothetical protein [Kitasatospora kifunensis]|uniref:TrbL/VirB6 plasmid conjugal transfer protein n=1 Tax=Kitasatospora kifunensis TaxID=58351 RepID=A0A7W7W0D5_KITKI|nr:hypothetical protein [Kitasatospora kifunensis]MBB4929053.1 hypothetical protein [Kitasatospora kifunensis]